MSDTPLLDWRYGEALRDEAIERVDRNADEEWKDAALRAVRTLALRLTSFTTDDVWGHLHDTGTAATGDPRALGAIMRRAQALGLIMPTSEWRLSERPACHRRPLRVWRAI